MIFGRDVANDVQPTLWPIMQHGSLDRVPALKTLSLTENDGKRNEEKKYDTINGGITIKICFYI